MILIGTAGWSYDDWAGVVYPAGKTQERLRTVARYLDCVEIDSSFYRPPTARMTEAWVRTTSDLPDFRFLAKAWQRFTHERASVWSQSDFDLFATGMTPLREAGKLDVLLFQFPWSFRNLPANRDWLQRITEAFAGWPVAVEVRHDSWTADLFRDRGLTYCNVDQPLLDHCLPLTAVVTSATGYYRLHGRNARNWFKEKQEVYGGRYDYLYSEEELRELLPPIRQVAAAAKKTFVILNNHKDGKAVANALQVKKLLEPGQEITAPSSLVDRFPVLRGCVRIENGAQLGLKL